jgi:hypothetical protein
MYYLPSSLLLGIVLIYELSVLQLSSLLLVFLHQSR